MSLSPKNADLVRRELVNPEIDEAEMLSFLPATINRLLDAARAEGKLDATIMPRIKVAEICFSLGWAAGYESAMKGIDGPCMPEAWRESSAKLLAEHPDDLADTPEQGAT